MSDEGRGERPFDHGLQPERTALAWRRTALAIAAGAIVATRVLPELLGIWAIVPSGIGLAIAVVILFAAHHRYRGHHHSLTTADTDRVALADGILPALVAVMCVAGGTLALAVVFVI